MIFGIGLERTYQCQMILFNDCRLCKECSKVRNGAMRSDVQTKVSEDVIFGVFLQIWWYDFVASVGCGTCFLEDDTFTGQDLETKTSMNHLKSYLWVRLRLEAYRLRAFQHFRPVSPTTICSFFFQSVYYRCIYNTKLFLFFCWTPPNPRKSP